MKTVRTRFLAPHSIEEAVRAVSRTGAAILAGGTDLMPRWSKNMSPKPASLVDLKRVEQLRGVKLVDGQVRIGACTLVSELEADPLIRAAAPILAQAASRVACPQIRNRATIGGNLCNASPAADTAVPLLLLDATLVVAAPRSDGVAMREISIAEFFHGPGRTALQPGEILTGIRFHPLASGTFSAWDKFGTRPAMEIAVASVGIVLELAGGKIAKSRLAYGSVAPVPLRGRTAEAAILNRPLGGETADRVVAAARDEISPISDVRASRDYRREIVGVMLRRMFENAASH